MADELTKREAPGALVVPEFLKNQHGGEGFDQMDKADLILPRIGICQSMTPQRKKSNLTYIEGLSDGDLFNSVSGQVYGESMEVIPLQFSKSRIYFKDLAQGGGILCQSFNGVDGGTIASTCAACPNSQFGADGLSPACNLFYNYPVLVLPSMELAMLSLKSSALKVAKRWNSRMKLLGDKPMFAGVYEVKIVEQSNQKGTFFSPVISFRRFVQEGEFNLAKELFAGMQGKKITTDETGLNDEAADAMRDENIPF
jgi:hypothetical protein